MLILIWIVGKQMNFISDVIYAIKYFRAECVWINTKEDIAEPSNGHSFVTSVEKHFAIKKQSPDIYLPIMLTPNRNLNAKYAINGKCLHIFSNANAATFNI